tara:strand:+ start:454 stop:882 length:429 start_codon:yes stop_codon:yes gene_type:complete
MYSLDQLYSQAMDGQAMRLMRNNNVSYINVGIKISKFPSKTEILNCSKNGDYFQELTNEEYQMFYNKGWYEGCIILAISNCIRKLKMIKKKMQEEVNTRKNDKYIKNLKTKREFVMNKYSYYTQKLIKLNNHDKIKISKYKG